MVEVGDSHNHLQRLHSAQREANKAAIFIWDTLLLSTCRAKRRLQHTLSNTSSIQVNNCLLVCPVEAEAVLFHTVTSHMETMAPLWEMLLAVASPQGRQAQLQAQHTKDTGEDMIHCPPACNQ